MEIFTDGSLDKLWLCSDAACNHEGKLFTNCSVFQNASPPSVAAYCVAMQCEGALKALKPQPADVTHLFVVVFTIAL